ncbi:acriflavin resistance protein [Pseudomonas saudimassiliensis]|uniref:Acriflavin resistance protein n=1 Tax=Pseudomonas saudimassiliensis TaxID=1461581 RepID=A0A078MFI3_9PSED|nr:efflux RND transporter permease subunit [Pseudomonas saudimassiliensis]CEA03466.1 acriflavin resistance protein [Pseudomonas saudimassiliensis]CEF26201.1 acriflavin resistance protein [Pseudomonas saudimassiliensis]
MSFNLSAWALRNRQIVLYFMLVLSVAGVLSYGELGQSEDPPFTFKAMVIRTNWPGATAEEVARQVSDRIEQKAMETGAYQQVVSYSRPGESTITFVALDSLDSAEIPELWYQLRKKIDDIRHTLPPDIVGPFYNDEFGTTFGNIYALTGDGFDYALLKDYAERLQLQLQRVSDVGKVELLGVQDEKIWIELSNLKLATLGLPLSAVQQALQEQNSLQEAGFFETTDERVRLRVSGQFESVEQIRQFPIRVGDRTFRIDDIADVRRGFNDPMAPRMRFMEQDALGLAVSMKPGGDILALGQTLEAEFERMRQTLPVGMELHKVSDQPEAVREGVGEFVKVLAEAVVIVLLVSFFSLGLRTGLVVALSIPLVLAMTFTVMNYFDIGLHKISLGALVLALGLMVDDAIIAAEMMVIKMEQGFDRIKAASFAWTSTAFPMLTGTLITAAGFLPIATAASGTGEYTRSIFQVVTIALLVSWIAAVIFVPYLGYNLLPDMAKLHAKKHGGDPAGHDPYATRFYQGVRQTVQWCVRHRWLVILVTLGLFVGSILLFRLVPQQFFPPSARTELMVDITLAEGSSLTATQAQAERLEQRLRDHPGIENFVAYVGTGSPRFYLPLDQQLPATNFSQFVIKAHSVADREELRGWLQALLKQEFPEVRTRISRLENGPPVGYPIQFRISGEHIDEVRRIAREVAVQVRANPEVANVHLNWEAPSKVVHLQIDQERARALGLSTSDVSRFLTSQLTGTTVSLFREGDELIEIALRGTADERGALENLASLAIPSGDGRRVALEQVATLEYGFEEGVIWRRDRLPTVTVRGDVHGDVQPPTLVQQIMPNLTAIRAELPPGYRFEVGGTVEDSQRGQKSIMAGMPLFLLVVMTLLMLQLRSISRSVMVFLTAPLGLIGVTLFLLAFREPFGFVAMLGTIALSGMIMRNSVILVDQIEQDIAAGHDPWHAVIEATVRRFRPIVLTALAAILAMIPLSRSVFFGPMAVAIMGGLAVATALTLLFLPALYAAWFRVRETEQRA